MKKSQLGTGRRPRKQPHEIREMRDLLMLQAREASLGRTGVLLPSGKSSQNTRPPSEYIACAKVLSWVLGEEDLHPSEWARSGQHVRE